MTNIVAFPGKDVKRNNLHKSLWDAASSLEVKYGELDEMHQMLNELEQSVSGMEREYDEHLKQYAEIVGDDEIEVGLLEYSSSAVIEVVPEAGTITIRWGTGKPKDMALPEGWEIED